MKRAAMAAGLVVGSLLLGAGVWGQKAPLLAEKDVVAIAGERNLEGTKPKLLEYEPKRARFIVPQQIWAGRAAGFGGVC